MSNVNTSNAPIVESKVKASTAASYLAGLVLLAVLNGVQDTDYALLLGESQWFETIVLPLVPAIATFVSGYLARHTYRPDLRGPVGPAGS